MNTLIHTIKNAGSGKGFHYWREFSVCPRRANLLAQAALDGRPSPDSGAGASVGSIFHAYMELRYSKSLAAEQEVKFMTEMSDVVLNQEYLAEARRLYIAYVQKFGRVGNDLGKVLHVEKSLSVDDKTTSMELFGVPEFSGRVDLITRLNEKDVCKLFPGRTDIRPGVYVIDHKTSSSQSSNHIDQRMNSLQYIGYQMLVEKLLNLEVAGCISNDVIRTKTPRFVRVVAPPADSYRRAILKSFLSGCYRIAEDTILRDWPNADVDTCYNYYHRCCPFASGLCSRMQ